MKRSNVPSDSNDNIETFREYSRIRKDENKNEMCERINKYIYMLKIGQTEKSYTPALQNSQLNDIINSYV